MSDNELMQSIKTKYGDTLTHITQASSIPPSFLAAMIANESGGDPNAKRYEASVLSSLWQVLLGRKAAYGSIGRADLVAYVADLPAPTLLFPATLPATLFQNVDGLATSWGLTQIMGYHVLEPGSPAQDHADLSIPDISIRSTIWLLTKFAEEFALDLATDFAELLHCWNAGAPSHPTFDANYVPNALARKAIYESLT